MMGRAERLEAQYQEELARSIVSETLTQLGLDNGYRNFSQCRKIYGKWFTDHAKRGDFSPVKVGNRKMYQVSAINAMRAAEARLAARRAAASEFEPNIV